MSSLKHPNLFLHKYSYRNDINYKNLNHLLIQLNEIIIENEVNKLVVGIPYNMKGEHTPQTLKVKEVIQI